jgi:peroxiredoxin
MAKDKNEKENKIHIRKLSAGTPNFEAIKIYVMKNITFMLLLFFSGMVAYSQDPAEILDQSAKKCKSIRSGEYEMRVMKQWAGTGQPTLYHYHAGFRKLKNNSVYPATFHSEGYNGNRLFENRMFTGNELVLMTDSDNSATVMNKKDSKDLMVAYCTAMDLYRPFTGKEMPGFSTNNSDERFKYAYVGSEPVNGEETYHIRITDTKPCDFEDQKSKALETDYWITKKDFVPVQYSMHRTLENNGDPQSQYEIMTLTSYTLNNESSGAFSLNQVPSRYKQSEYEPFKNPKLLNVTASAPAWNLPSLTDEYINLNSYRGQVVLIDFFYKGCSPCNMAIPGLKKLHEKYDDKGLEVIGIDPFDKKESGISDFIKKKGIKYPVLLSGKETADQYKVTGYPSIYLLDKEGKIIFSQIGYDEELDGKLENLIRSELGISSR